MKLLTAGYSLRLLIARVNISDTKLLLYHNETRLFTKAARLFGCKTFSQETFAKMMAKSSLLLLLCPWVMRLTLLTSFINNVLLYSYGKDNYTDKLILL